MGQGLVLGSAREKVLSGDEAFSKTFAPEELFQPDQGMLPPGMSVTIDQDAKPQAKGEVYSPHARSTIGPKGQSTRHVSDLGDRAIVEGRKSEGDSGGSKKGRIRQPKRPQAAPS